MAEIQLKAAAEAAALRAAVATTSAPEQQNSDGVFALLLQDAQNGPSTPVEANLPAPLGTDTPDGAARLTPADAVLPDMFPGMALLLPLMPPAALPGRNAAAAGVATGVAGVFTATPFVASAAAPGCASTPGGAASTALIATSLPGVNSGPVTGNSVASPGILLTANSASAANPEAKKMAFAAAAAAFSAGAP